MTDAERDHALIRDLIRAQRALAAAIQDHGRAKPYPDETLVYPTCPECDYAGRHTAVSHGKRYGLLDPDRVVSIALRCPKCTAETRWVVMHARKKSNNAAQP